MTNREFFQIIATVLARCFGSGRLKYCQTYLSISKLAASVDAVTPASISWLLLTAALCPSVTPAFITKWLQAKKVDWAEGDTPLTLLTYIIAEPAMANSLVLLRFNKTTGQMTAMFKDEKETKTVPDVEPGPINNVIIVRGDFIAWIAEALQKVQPVKLEPFVYSA